MSIEKNPFKQAIMTPDMLAAHIERVLEGYGTDKIKGNVKPAALAQFKQAFVHYFTILDNLQLPQSTVATVASSSSAANSSSSSSSSASSDISSKTAIARLEAITSNISKAGKPSRLAETHSPIPFPDQLQLVAELLATAEKVFKETHALLEGFLMSLNQIDNIMKELEAANKAIENAADTKRNYLQSKASWPKMVTPRLAGAIKAAKTELMDQKSQALSKKGIITSEQQALYGAIESVRNASHTRANEIMNDAFQSLKMQLDAFNRHDTTSPTYLRKMCDMVEKTFADISQMNTMIIENHLGNTHKTQALYAHYKESLDKKLNNIYTEQLPYQINQLAKDESLSINNFYLAVQQRISRLKDTQQLAADNEIEIQGASSKEMLTHICRAACNKAVALLKNDLAKVPALLQAINTSNNPFPTFATLARLMQTVNSYYHEIQKFDNVDTPEFVREKMAHLATLFDAAKKKVDYGYHIAEQYGPQARLYAFVETHYNTLDPYNIINDLIRHGKLDIQNISDILDKPEQFKALLKKACVIALRSNHTDRSSGPSTSDEVHIDFGKSTVSNRMKALRELIMRDDTFIPSLLAATKDKLELCEYIDENYIGNIIEPSSRRASTSSFTATSTFTSDPDGGLTVAEDDEEAIAAAASASTTKKRQNKEDIRRALNALFRNVAQQDKRFWDGIALHCFEPLIELANHERSISTSSSCLITRDDHTLAENKFTIIAEVLSDMRTCVTKPSCETLKAADTIERQLQIKQDLHAVVRNKFKDFGNADTDDYKVLKQHRNPVRNVLLSILMWLPLGVPALMKRGVSKTWRIRTEAECKAHEVLEYTRLLVDTGHTAG